MKRSFCLIKQSLICMGMLAASALQPMRPEVLAMHTVLKDAQESCTKACNVLWSGREPQGSSGDTDAAAAAHGRGAAGAGAAGGHAACGADDTASRLLPHRPDPLLRAAVGSEAAAALWSQVRHEPPDWVFG